MQIDGKSKVLGIFGDPIQHSLSPKMQNAALKAAGINAAYLPFHVEADAVSAAVASLRALNLVGVNVTVPHKEAVIPFLDEVDDSARLIGAVNVIVNRQGRLCGYNTDGLGLLRSLDEAFGFAAEGKNVVLLGAGGACRAAVVALANAGCARLTIANRTVANAERLVTEFAAAFPDVDIRAVGLDEQGLCADLATADLLVNTTTVGLHGETFSFNLFGCLKKTAVFYDMVYAPSPTPPQLSAAEHGVDFADGRGMLVGQGEEAFYLWFGELPPRGVMGQAVDK